MSGTCEACAYPDIAEEDRGVCSPECARERMGGQADWFRSEIAEAAELLLRQCLPCDPETDRADCVTALAGICDEAEACDFVRRHANLLAPGTEGEPYESEDRP